MAKFEEFNHLIEAIKNIILLVFYSTLFILFLIYGLPFIKEQMKDNKQRWVLEGIEIGGLKLARVSNELNTKDRTQNLKAKDVKVDVASIQAAKYLDKSLESEVKKFWIYVGQYTDKEHWITQNFILKKSNSTALAVNDAYKREAIPVKITADDWRLGKIVGYIKQGEQLNLLKDTTIEGNNVWALVK